MDYDEYPDIDDALAEEESMLRQAAGWEDQLGNDDQAETREQSEQVNKPLNADADDPEGEANLLDDERFFQDIIQSDAYIKEKDVEHKRPFQWKPSKVAAIPSDDIVKIKQDQLVRNVLLHRKLMAKSHRQEVRGETDTIHLDLTGAAPTTTYLYQRPPLCAYITPPNDSDNDSDAFVDCFEVVLRTGDLCYIGMRNADAQSRRTSHFSAALTRLRGNLLPTPIHQLQTELNKQALEGFQSAMSRADAALANVDLLLNGKGDEPHLAEEEDESARHLGTGPEESEEAALTGNHRASSALWVDKYAPRVFADLLSSEKINRNVLKWIKLWDARVFGENDTTHAGSKRRSSAAPVGIAAAKRAKGALGAPLTTAESGADDSRPTGVKRFGGFSSAVADKGSTTGANQTYFGGSWKPEAKVLLLCGNPGTGKTTLAHIVARQAGYKPMEINASDDRSSKTIRERIADAQAMQSVFGEKKPSLIVLDEIDGIEGGPNGGIAELVKMIKATASLIPKKVYNDSINDFTKKKGGQHAEGSDNDEPPKEAVAAKQPKTATSSAKMKFTKVEGQPSSDNNSIQPLMRPLICICNDQYAPALRELRPLVQVVEFGKTSTERLVMRLKAICRAEGLMITQDALQTLVTITDNDIRSSLNTLQFIKYQADASRKVKASATSLHSVRVTSDMISRAAVGIRDQTKALFDVWNAVFRKPDIRMRSSSALQSLGMAVTGAGISSHVSKPQSDDKYGRIAQAMGSNSMTAAAASTITSAAAAYGKEYINELVSQISAYSSDARLFLNGLYENLPNSRCPDPTLMHTWKSLDWLCYGEELTNRTLQTQSFALMKFLPVVGVGIHAHMSSEMPFKASWPKSDSFFRSTQDHKRNIITTFLHGRLGGGAALASGSLDARSTVLDILSPLITITSPPLRPVNFGLMNSREKRDAQELVQTLAQLGLSYISKTQGEKRFRFKSAGEEETSYVLQPEIQTLVAFEGYSPWDGEMRTPMPEILKQLLAHEVRQARIRCLHKRDVQATEPTSAAPMAAHLKQHIESMTAAENYKAQAKDSDTVPATPTGLSSEDIDMTQQTAKAMAGQSFLVQAAEKSRAAEIARRRVSIAVAEATKKAVVTSARGKYPVIYKYQEGFTNAVRRPVRVSDFL